MPEPAFSHLQPALMQFLVELDANNNRQWFSENKARYEKDVREPCLDFIAAMAEPLAGFAPHFLAWPKKSGGSLMRIHRDVRFARDKRPYKTNVGIQFRHESARDVHAPGYYLHIDPHQCFLGVGAWRPAAELLYAIRLRIAEHPRQWATALGGRKFKANYRLGGDSLIRAPRGFDAEHPCIEDIKRKDFIAMTTLDPQLLWRPGLVTHVAEQFRHATGFMKFLCAAANVSL
ncbi:MAG: TIGR02453 family protein [Gammaproteobacteria bacterium]